MDPSLVGTPTLSEKQLAKRLGKKPTTVRKWRERRTGPAYYRNGAEVFYKLEDVRLWLESQRVDPAEPKGRRGKAA